MDKKVAIERCNSYEPQALYNAMKRAVELAGGPDVAGRTVLLKPNIVHDMPPESAIGTHPLFVEAAIRLARDMGAGRILVGDSPGIHTRGFSPTVCGIAQVIQKNNAEWVDFTRRKIKVPCPDGKTIKMFTLSDAVQQADVIISLPKLKSHEIMYFSGAMKNMFGFIPSMGKTRMHFRLPDREAFASMLVDLSLAIKPSFAIMDAITGMEGHGPAKGKARHIGIVLASSNMLAMDAAASSVIGYPPEAIPVSREALGRGAWLSSFSEIEYPGLSPEEVLVPDYLKMAIKKNKLQIHDIFNSGRAKTITHWQQQ